MLEERAPSAGRLWKVGYVAPRSTARAWRHPRHPVGKGDVLSRHTVGMDEKIKKVLLWVALVVLALIVVMYITNVARGS